MLGIKEFEADIAAGALQRPLALGLRDDVGRRPRPARRDRDLPEGSEAAHGAAVWGSAAVTLPALEVAPPFVFWGRKEVAIDLFHHAVYATATGIAYRLIDERA